ncbi:MAG: TetR/AcrR family transcriptional regulator [Elusimicrobiota bacterium]
MTFKEARTLPEAVRKRLILDAARRLLVRRGYRDIPLDDVAREAKVAKGTLYLYFKDKDDLMSASLQDVGDRLDQALERIPAHLTGRKALCRVAEVHLAFSDQHRDFLAQLVPGNPLLHGSTAGRAIQKKFSSHLALLAGRWIQPCVTQGLLRRHDPRVGAMFFMSLVRFFMIRNFLLKDKRPLKAYAEELVSLYLNGLGGGR